MVEKVPATVITAEPTSPAVAGQAPEASSTEIDSKLEQLKNKVFSEIYKVADGLSSKTNTVYQAVSLTNKIDTLNSVSISNASITGSTYAGSVSGTSGSFSDSLSANGGFSATTGTFSGNLTVTGVPTFYGALTLPYFTATSTTATSIVAGQFLNTFVPSVAHTFGAWSPGVAGSNPLAASVMINPSSATVDSNLFSISVANSAKFLIDAEGDVFANSLTASGGVTLSTTTASTFSVENNSTFGDATTTDRTYFNSRIGSSLIPNTNNLLDIGDTTNGLAWRTGIFGTSIGVGTTSPYAALSVVGETVSTYFTATSTTATSTFMGAFSIGSTTPSSSALFSVGTSSPLFFVDKNSGNIGIGLASSDSPLRIDGNNCRTRLNYNDGTNQYGFFQSDQGGCNYNYFQNSIGIGTTTTFGIGNKELSINAPSGVAGLGFGVGGTMYGYLNSGATQTFLTSQGSQPLVLGTNGIERLRIDSSGNVGIGSTTPINKLVVKNSSNTAQLALEQDNTNHGWTLFADSSNGAIKFSRYGSSAGERMKIDINGNVSTDNNGGIKWKVLSGTTDGSGNLSVAHGLTTSAIIGIDAKVYENGFAKRDPGEYGGHVYADPTNVVIDGSLGGNWAGRPAKIIIFYSD